MIGGGGNGDLPCHPFDVHIDFHHDLFGCNAFVLYDLPPKPKSLSGQAHYRVSLILESGEDFARFLSKRLGSVSGLGYTELWQIGLWIR